MSKGKNFSANNTSGKRGESDFYQTPLNLTRRFLREEKFEGTILEPARGKGAILKVLLEFDYTGMSSYDKEKDFLKETEQYDNVFTNPPFSLTQSFILKAKQVAQRKIALLLPLSYLHGKRRYDAIYQDKEFPLSKVYVFTRYPLLTGELRYDEKYETGMLVYAWYVWDKEHKGPPTIHWLDNNEDIVSKRKSK